MTAEALARTVQEWRDKVAAAGMRRWPEWVGKTPDAKIPEKVQDRVVLVWGHTCYLTGAPLGGKKPEFEHVIPLSMGGEHREGNLRPVSKQAHKLKTAKEAAQRAKADAQRRGAVVTKEPTMRGRPKPEKPIRDKLPLPRRTHDIYGRPL